MLHVDQPANVCVSQCFSLLTLMTVMDQAHNLLLEQFCTSGLEPVAIHFTSPGVQKNKAGRNESMGWRVAEGEEGGVFRRIYIGW